MLIPAYAINAILNKIPILGKIITGIEGHPIIGFNYKIAGNYENPEYSINPFSVLTPGIVEVFLKYLVMILVRKKLKKTLCLINFYYSVCLETCRNKINLLS